MTTVVVTQQPGVGRQLRNWNSGLCGCCDDIGSCLVGLCCCPFYYCHVSSKAGECCLAPYCIPGAMSAIRLKVRTRFGIQGSLFYDCMAATCCGPCAACQISREIDYSGNGHL